MDFFCYHRDRPGSMPLRTELLEEHWAYMDRFDATMVARGPTFAIDGTLTGSVHILGLPDPSAARDFAFDEPGYQAGAYRDVLLRRWENLLGRTMWDRLGDADTDRYLVVGFTSEPAPGDAALPSHDDLIAFGALLSDDATRVLGAAALLEAPDAETARDILSPERYDGVEVHRWRPGGRPPPTA
jgi:uncharacterized protein